MALGDLFKSKQERERESNKARRKAFRQAEGAVDVVKDRIGNVKQDRDKSWAEARRYLKDGQKPASQRCLQSCRAAELMISKLEMKRWVFEQLLTRLELSKTDQEFTTALSAINTVVTIDPEAVADVLGEVEDKLGDQVDVDKVWEKMHGKEMAGVENQATDAIPSMEDMQKQLEDEAAAELEHGRRPVTQTDGLEKTPAPAVADDDIKARIGEGKRRLRDLLEGDK